MAAIRRGEAEHIAGEFPQDVAPLATEVNQLIDANREIVERARTQVGNLAHALKTPLSVLMNEADSMSPALPEKVREQTEIMRRQVTFYLDRARAAARARTFGVATEVKPVVEGLVRTYEKLHGDQVLTFDVALQPGLKFRGEAQDLTDLIGNLLDNAGKWARERVSIHAAAPPPKGIPIHFLSRRLTTMGRASTRTRAPRRSSGESGLTSRGPAPALACRSSSSSPRSTAARSSSTKARSAACARSCGCHACEPRLRDSAFGEPQMTEPRRMKSMRLSLLMIAIGSIGLAGCQSVGSSDAPPVTGSTTPAGAAASTVAPAPAGIPAPAIPTGAALGGVLGGPVGSSLTDDDRQAAWQAQVGALDSGQKRSWRGAKGVFGFVEPGAATGDGCRAYSQTIYVAGRPNRGQGVGCKQPDGSWKMTS